MNLRQDAFLSPEIAKLAAEVQYSYREHLALVHRLNRFAMDVFLNRPHEHERDADAVAPALLGRAIQDFEAAVILGLSGMRAQARSMARSTFETACYCVAACRDATVRTGRGRTMSIMDAIASTHQKFRLNIAREVAPMPELPKAHRPKLQALEHQITASGDADEINLKKLTDDLGLQDMYTLIYRPLSQDAHPNLTSLLHQCEIANGEIVRYRIGPDYGQFGDTVTSAAAGLLMAVGEYIVRYGTAKDREEADALAVEHRRVADLPEPATETQEAPVVEAQPFWQREPGA